MNKINLKQFYIIFEDSNSSSLEKIKISQLKKMMLRQD